MPSPKEGMLVREAGFYLARDFCESGLVHHRQIREHLAVDLDVGAFQAGHERDVVHSQLAHRSVYPGDPQRTELPLPLPAVAVGILPRLHDRLLGDPVDVSPAAAEPFRLLQDLLVARTRRYSSFDSWHVALLRTSTATSSGWRACWSSPPRSSGEADACAWCSSW